MAGIGLHPPMDKHLFDSPLAESDTVHYSRIHRPFRMPLRSGFPSSTGEVSGALTKQLLAFWILHDPHYHVQMIDGNDWTRASPVWRSIPIINLFEWLNKTYKSHHICKNPLSCAAKTTTCLVLPVKYRATSRIVPSRKAFVKRSSWGW